MNLKGEYFKFLRSQTTRAELDEYGDLVTIAPLVQLLNSNLTDSESNQILLMIGTRLRPLYQPFLFEFNDSITRAKVKHKIADILEPLWALRLCYEAPTVICDETNNTPKTVNENDIITDIMFRVSHSPKLYRIRLSVGKISAETTDPWRAE